MGKHDLPTVAEIMGRREPPDAPTVAVELTAQEIVDLSVTAAYVAKVANGEQARRYARLVTKLLQVFASSGLDVPTHG